MIPALRELSGLGWARILLCHFKDKGTQLGGFLASALGPYGQEICGIRQCTRGRRGPEKQFFSTCPDFLRNYSFVVKFFDDTGHCSESSSQSNL